MFLSSREEPFRDATLIEHLDRAGVKTPGPRSVDMLTGAAFDDDDVDPRQRQFARQHHPSGTSSRDCHRMVRHLSVSTIRSSSPRFWPRATQVNAGIVSTSAVLAASPPP
jgi:hypothetical protein